MAYVPFRRSEYSLPDKTIQIALGNDARYGLVNKFGSNLDIGTTFEDVWTQGGTLSYLSSAETMNVASTSTNDDADPAGTGAQTVVLQGVDGDYNLAEETVSLNGTSNVETTATFLRIFRMYCEAVGTNGVNVGNITATASSAGTVQGVVEADEGQSLMALYTVPTDKYALITGFSCQTGGNDTAIIELMRREKGKSWRVQNQSEIGAGSTVTYNFLPGLAPILAPPESDKKIRAKKTGSGGATEVSATFSILLVDSREVTS